MGSLYGNPTGAAAMGSGLDKALKGIYSGAAQRAGSIGRPGAPIIRISPEEVNNYARQANTAYLAGMKNQQSGNVDQAIKQYASAVLIRLLTLASDSFSDWPLVLRAESHAKIGICCRTGAARCSKLFT